MKGYDELGDQSHRMTTETRQQTRIYVQTAAAVCEDKKGVDTRILELDPIDSGLSDFFLITSATNDRQAIAIADEIEDRLKKDFGVFPNSVEGRRQGQWILLDYVDFVVHVFLADRRAFYDIERLRKSARPLTPAEFDAELKAELAARTLAARGKAAAKPAPKATKPSPKPKKPAKKSVVRPALKTKKAAGKKAPKLAARKSKTAKPTAGKSKAKPAVKKSAVKKKPAAKKIAARKAPAKKSAAKKVAPRKPAPKKKKR
jgi:ribosome-associated protein